MLYQLFRPHLDRDQNDEADLRLEGVFREDREGERRKEGGMRPDWCQMCRSQYKSKLSLGADSNDNKTWRVVIKLSRVQSWLVWKLLISVP